MSKELAGGASSQKTRMKLNLTIEVERVEFDAEQCSLRVNGKNMEENDA